MNWCQYQSGLLYKASRYIECRLGRWCKKLLSSPECEPTSQTRALFWNVYPEAVALWHRLDAGRSSLVSAMGNTEVASELMWLTPANLRKSFNPNRYPTDKIAITIGIECACVIKCVTLISTHCAFTGTDWAVGLCHQRKTCIYYWNQFEHVDPPAALMTCLNVKVRPYIVDTYCVNNTSDLLEDSITHDYTWCMQRVHSAHYRWEMLEDIYLDHTLIKVFNGLMVAHTESWQGHLIHYSIHPATILQIKDLIGCSGNLWKTLYSTKLLYKCYWDIIYLGIKLYIFLTAV